MFPPSIAGRFADRDADKLAAMSVDTEERDDLQRELDRRGVEILRLRDLLMVKDAELGAVRGQLAELENVARGLMMAAGRVQRRVPWAMRIAGAVLRRLRGRSGRSGA
jgi:hypothetical protein